MAFDLFSLLGGGALGLLAGAAGAGLWASRRLIDLEKRNAMLEAQQTAARASLDEHFRALAAQALDANARNFLNLAESRLKEAQTAHSHDVDKKQKAISDLVDPIGKTLKEMEGKIETLGKAGAGIETHLKTFGEDQRRLRDVTQKLVETMRHNSDRGRWGEMHLQRTLELAGMVEGTHFSRQVATSDGEGSRVQPDFVIHLPGNGCLVVDVKTPLAPFWRDDAEEATDEATLASFRAAMKSHIRGLSDKKYWSRFESPEFVIMFLPSEGLYSLALRSDPALIDEAARNRIILASPTILIGLLRIIMHAWQQYRLADEARDIARMGGEIHQRLGVFLGHFAKIESGLRGAVESYNKAVASYESRVAPVLRRFRDLPILNAGDEVRDIAQVEHTPRILAAPVEGETPETLTNSRTGTN